MKRVVRWLPPTVEYEFTPNLFHNLFPLDFPECLRKRARADVTLISPGTGQVTINGQDINYFSSTQCREQVSGLVLILSMIATL